MCWVLCMKVYDRKRALRSDKGGLPRAIRKRCAHVVVYCERMVQTSVQLYTVGYLKTIKPIYIDIGEHLEWRDDECSAQFPNAHLRQRHNVINNRGVALVRNNNNEKGYPWATLSPSLAPKQYAVQMLSRTTIRDSNTPKPKKLVIRYTLHSFEHPIKASNPP